MSQAIRRQLASSRSGEVFLRVEQVAHCLPALRSEFQVQQNALGMLRIRQRAAPAAQTSRAFLAEYSPTAAKDLDLFVNERDSDFDVDEKTANVHLQIRLVLDVSAIQGISAHPFLVNREHVGFRVVAIGTRFVFMSPYRSLPMSAAPQLQRFALQVKSIEELRDAVFVLHLFRDVKSLAPRRDGMEPFALGQVAYSATHRQVVPLRARTHVTPRAYYLDGVDFPLTPPGVMAHAYVSWEGPTVCMRQPVMDMIQSNGALIHAVNQDVLKQTNAFLAQVKSAVVGPARSMLIMPVPLAESIHEGCPVGSCWVPLCHMARAQNEREHKTRDTRTAHDLLLHLVKWMEKMFGDKITKQTAPHWLGKLGALLPTPFATLLDIVDDNATYLPSYPGPIQQASADCEELRDCALWVMSLLDLAAQYGDCDPRIALLARTRQEYVMCEVSVTGVAGAPKEMRTLLLSDSDDVIHTIAIAFPRDYWTSLLQGDFRSRSTLPVLVMDAISGLQCSMDGLYREEDLPIARILQQRFYCDCISMQTMDGPQPGIFTTVRRERDAVGCPMQDLLLQTTAMQGWQLKPIYTPPRDFLRILWPIHRLQAWQPWRFQLDAACMQALDRLASPTTPMRGLLLPRERKDIESSIPLFKNLNVLMVPVHKA